jgi:hypothetical protein
VSNFHYTGHHECQHSGGAMLVPPEIGGSSQAVRSAKRLWPALIFPINGQRFDQQDSRFHVVATPGLDAVQGAACGDRVHAGHRSAVVAVILPLGCCRISTGRWEVEAVYFIIGFYMIAGHDRLSLGKSFGRTHVLGDTGANAG